MPTSETDPNELVRYSVENKVATITLNRPEKLNAFSDELVVAVNVEPVRCRSRGVHSHHPRSRASLLGADVHQRQLRKREEFERLKVMALTPPTSCVRLRHALFPSDRQASVVHLTVLLNPGQSATRRREPRRANPRSALSRLSILGGDRHGR